MEKKVLIENLKGIEKLEFILPNKEGVYLLVGANGMGKTSILTCLERLGNPLAFSHGFTNTNNLDNIDSYLGASIKYDVTNKSGNSYVTFTKKKAKWAPSPKIEGRSVLKKFGFSNTVFIRADSKRIDAKREDIRKGVYSPASKDVKEAMNEIFETDKYNQLLLLKISNGRGKTPTTFYVMQNKDKSYYSEKRFSTGELAILRLTEKISSTANNTLFLLDEAEMALHPRVQINLLKYLVEKAEVHKLVVILATHSSTLIYNSNKNNIILLKQETKGNYFIETPCYPSLAIGMIDYTVNKFFDAIYFVEDDMARELLKKSIKRYMNECKDKNYSAILYTIIPVGGFVETADFAIRTSKQLFNKSKVFAVLDEDAFSEGIIVRPDFAKTLKFHSEKIVSLGATPELWIINNLESKDRDEINQQMTALFNCELVTIMNDENYKKINTGKPRKDAKLKLRMIMDYTRDYSGDNEEIILDKLLDLLIKCFSKEQIGKIVSPLINGI